MNRNQIYAVFFGGAVGAVARWGTLEILPFHTQWPWQILFINVLGSAALGVLVGYSIRTSQRIFFLAASTGFCGAFTTFSAYTVDIALFIRAGQFFNGFSYLITSTIGGLAAYKISKQLTEAKGQHG
ncbi:MAG: CrcB family protein [Acidimicrobiales bacterium]|nr:CrcB family protein [Acidimicrobiales bacterium]